MLLKGKRALVMGVANEQSLAWSIAKKLNEEGVAVALSYAGDNHEKRVRPLGESIDSPLIEKCNVDNDSEIDNLFKNVKERLKSIDILIHSIAYAPLEELSKRTVDTSRSGFRTTLETSVFSFLATVKQAEKIMNNGGTVLTLTNYGSERVIPRYNIMGIAKSALESAVRYTSIDLGEKKITVNAISAGPVKTLSASGISNFRSFLEMVEEKSPLHENITGDDVGMMATFLCGPGGRHITGSTFHVDSGVHIVGA
jgi:enoyl-[acyl-carrier protein] reductase I